MSPFWSGFLGALAALFVLVAVRRVVWFALWRGRWHRHGAGRRLGWLLRRIDARPEQERVLQAELDAFFADARGLRGEARGAREEIARLFAGPSLDEAAVAAALERPLARVKELEARLAGSIARVHAILDGAQRERLASIVAHAGHRHRRHGGHGPAAA